MTDRILLEKHGDGLVILTFNRPQSLNALDLAMMRRFAALVADLQSDAHLRAVVLTGAGSEAFCSGGDLYELSRYPTADDALSFITLMGNALLDLERLPVPIIAAINGYALGGGSEIAIACDLRFVDQAAQMGFVQINMGLTPGWGAGQRLLRLVGYSKALRLLTSGHIMEASELLALGLADKVVEPGQALNAALYYARRHIIRQPPAVVRSIKALLRAGLEQPYEQALGTDRHLFPALWADKPHLEAVDHFLKRQQTKKDDV